MAHHVTSTHSIVRVNAGAVMEPGNICEPARPLPVGHATNRFTFVAHPSSATGNGAHGSVTCYQNACCRASAVRAVANSSRRPKPRCSAVIRAAKWVTSIQIGSVESNREDLTRSISNGDERCSRETSILAASVEKQNAVSMRTTLSHTRCFQNSGMSYPMD